MSEELATVEAKPEAKPPVDDAIVVHDELTEEQGNEQLVAKVTKLLEDKPGDSDTREEPEKPGKPETPAPEAEVEAVGEMSSALQARVKDAGLPEEFAQQLHESGQLEQALSAIDRRLIDYVQSKEPKEGEKEPSSKDKPVLDPDEYPEDLVAHATAQEQRIAALESMIEELKGGQRSGFDQWFDGAIEKLGVNPSDNEKCQTVFKAYEAVCAAFGTDPNARNTDMVQRAYAAMYPNDVFKKQIARLRDTEGKFVSSPASRGGPPPKDATPEEVESALVSRVGAYLKEQGVEMSGY